MQEIYLNVKIPDECPLNLKCFWAFAKKCRHLSSITRMHFIDRPFSENKPQRYLYTKYSMVSG